MSQTKLPQPTRQQILDYISAKGRIRAEGGRLWADNLEFYIDRDRGYLQMYRGGRALPGRNNLERLQRIVGLDMLRHSQPDEFLKYLKGRQLKRTSQRGNELWSTREMSSAYYWTGGLVQHWLRYTCPSTGQVYVSGVPAHIPTPDAAMAWKFDITLAEYLSIEQET